MEDKRVNKLGGGVLFVLVFSVVVYLLACPRLDFVFVLLTYVTKLNYA